jgi:5-methylcytosine-specific restriction protein B
MRDHIPVYDGRSATDIERMAQAVSAAFDQASVSIVEDSESESDELLGVETVTQISPIPELIGINPEVYRQINSALSAGFRHLLFYGPPGTGKTTIAQRVAGVIHDSWKLITGSADFTSQDILGGYIPLEGGKLKFFPGVLLENFDKPLIFDELNRCDIDKVIGPLFTMLSGQSTTLPYLTDPSDENSPRIEIRPKGVSEPPQAYAPSPKWKLIATINSIDKASLYQMSYALTRRFAWIYVDVPTDPSDFVRTFISRQRESSSSAVEDVPLGSLWAAINEVRPIGPAPIIDIIKLIESQKPGFDFLAPVTDPALAELYLDGFGVFIMPMLDGILRDQGERIVESLSRILMLSDEASSQLRTRLLGMTI